MSNDIARQPLRRPRGLPSGVGAVNVPDEFEWKDPVPMTLANRIVAEAESIVRLAELGTGDDSDRP